jgi:hypothetical protein
MRKLHLSKERLGELSTEDLAGIVGAATGVQCDVKVGLIGTVKDTQCGPNCTTTNDLNKCYITINCDPPPHTG